MSRGVGLVLKALIHRVLARPYGVSTLAQGMK